MRFLPRVAIAAAFAVAPLAGAAAQTGPAAPAAQNDPAAAAAAAGSDGPPPMTAAEKAQAARDQRRAAAQDRELDQIGSELLKNTPKNPPNDDAATGGGLEPPH